jgi:hypothetical protein
MGVATKARRTSGLPRRRLTTVVEFDRASALGLYQPGERLELIEGEVIEKVSPQSNAHAVATMLMEEALRAALHTGHHVRVQMPLALDPHNKPEPDLAVVVGSIRDSAAGTPANAVLVVEVADTPLGYDGVPFPFADLLP